MGEQAIISAAVSDATLTLVDRAAIARGLTREAYAAEAIRRAAEEEAELLAFVQVGIDAADRGELVGQDEMEAWFEERIREHARR